MRALGQAKPIIRQQHLLQPLRVAPRAAQGRNRAGGGGQNVFHHLIRQSRQIAPAPTIRRRQGHVQHAHSKPRQFARDHPCRAKNRGFFRIRQPFARRLRRPRGDHRHMQRTRQVFVANGLGQKQQRVKSLFKIAVKKAGTGPETGLARHQPEMRDPTGGMPARHQIADQEVITFAAPFWGQNIARLTVAGKTVTSPHHGYPMASGTQSVGTSRSQPFGIGKNQPALRRSIAQIGTQIKPGCRLPPLRLPPPMRHIRDAFGHRLRIGHARGTRFDKIGFALKRIGWQRHPVAPRTAPDRRPVHRHTAGPKPGNCRYMPGIIGHLLIGMP